MSVDSGLGNRSADDDLEALGKVEEGESFSFPGTTNVKSVIGKLKQRIAQDNATNLEDNGLDNTTQHADLMKKPVPVGPLAELGIDQTFNTPVEDAVPTRLNSKFHQASTDSPMATPAAVAAPTPAPIMPNAGVGSAGASAGSVPTPTVPPSTIPTPTTQAGQPQTGIMMPTASFNKVAWIMEHGESKCASCEQYYVPESIEHARTAHCGFPGCSDAEGVVDYTQEGPHTFVPNGNADDHFTLAAGKIEEGDTVDGDVIKTGDEETKLASTDDYLEAFTREASDSALYYRGYEDAKSSKELDEDLAELSDDYFHGYEQFKFYHQVPQQSVPQTLYDIKPNSNYTPRDLMQGDADRGLNELTDGHSMATASVRESLADPKAFGQQLMADEAAKRQQHQMNKQMLMQNMMFMNQGEQAEKGSEAVCKACETLGNDSEHHLHASLPNGPTTPDVSTKPKLFLPNRTVASKLEFPTDVVSKFFGE